MVSFDHPPGQAECKPGRVLSTRGHAFRYAPLHVHDTKQYRKHSPRPSHHLHAVKRPAVPSSILKRGFCGSTPRTGAERLRSPERATSHAKRIRRDTPALRGFIVNAARRNTIFFCDSAARCVSSLYRAPVGPFTDSSSSRGFFLAASA